MVGLPVFVKYYILIQNQPQQMAFDGKKQAVTFFDPKSLTDKNPTKFANFVGFASVSGVVIFGDILEQGQ